MVTKRKLFTDARTGRFEGNLPEKLKVYSPNFTAVLMPPFGDIYHRFNKKDPSLISVTNSSLVPDWVAILVCSYEQGINNNLLSRFEEVGISLKIPEYSSKEFIDPLREKIKEQFYEQISKTNI